jgi:hypothetical protein
VQTFLPVPDFAATAALLDVRRLGKQRVETLQVLRGLTVPGYGWRHHPAVAMWRGYAEALVRYGLEMCEVWSAGGRSDTCAVSLSRELAGTCGIRTARAQDDLAAAQELPPWIGDDAFHRSHRSALVRKDPAHYAHLFPDADPGLPYVWPSSDRAPTL